MSIIIGMFGCFFFSLLLISLGFFFMLGAYFGTLLEGGPRLFGMIIVWGTIFGGWYLSIIIFGKVGDYIDKLDDDTIKRLDRMTLIIVVVALFILIACSNHGGNWTCYDKTSIDYNRQNDMKCVNEKGDVKRTDYEGARKIMGK